MFVGRHLLLQINTTCFEHCLNFVTLHHALSSRSLSVERAPHELKRNSSWSSFKGELLLTMLDLDARADHLLLGIDIARDSGQLLMLSADF